MKNKFLRTGLEYLPAIVTALLAVITLILYATVITEHEVSKYLCICFIPAVPFALIFLNRKFTLGIPRYLIMLVCLHLILSVDGGTAMGLYGRLPWWDLMVHGFFGFLGCAFFYYLYFRFEKQPPKPIHMIVFLLLTIALAGIWEMYEFVADLILHSDMQGVEGALAQGISPLTDTMTDMMIAIAGAVLFYAALFIRKVFFPKRKKGGGEMS